MKVYYSLDGEKTWQPAPAGGLHVRVAGDEGRTDEAVYTFKPDSMNVDHFRGGEHVSTEGTHYAKGKGKKKRD